MKTVEHGTGSESLEGLQAAVTEHRARCASGASKSMLPRELRKRILAQLAGGISASTLSKSLQIDPRYLYKWQRVARKKAQEKADTDAARPRVFDVEPDEVPRPRLNDSLRFEVAGFSVLISRSSRGAQ